MALILHEREISADGKSQHEWAQTVALRRGAAILSVRGTKTGSVVISYAAESNAMPEDRVVYLAARGERVPETGGATFLGVVEPAGMAVLHVWAAALTEHTQRDVEAGHA